MKIHNRFITPPHVITALFLALSVLAACQTEVTPKEYTLILDGNDGSGSIESIKKAENEEINLPSVTFTRTGYEFTGWNTAADGSGRAYTGGDKFKFTADTVLYAQWKKTETPQNPSQPETKTSYTIKFDANGGSGEMKEITAESGSEITLAANAFSKEGFTFSGWATSDYGNIVHKDEAKITLTENLTLYAQWTEIGKVEKVTFSATGEVDYNDKITLSCGTEGAAIYYLLVAGTDAPTAEEFSSSKQKYSEPLAITENAVIAAVAVKDGMKDSEIATATFTVKTYTVTFETEHGTAPAKIEGLKKGDKLGDKLQELTAKGYVFSGWFNGETRFTAETELSSDITLTAKWTPNTYTVTFNANGGSGEMETQTFSYGIAQELSENAFTKTNYTFIGWATEPDGDSVYSDRQSYTTGTENITLYARWTATQYSIIYNNVENAQNDNPVDYNVESETITLKELSRTGYTFGGWFKEDSFATKVTEIAKGSGGDVTLYAKWTANTYTVTFDANGGVGSMGAQTFTYGTEQTLSENAFSKDGYAFAGWAKSADGNAAYQNKRNIQIEAEDMTLYAVWWKWDADEFAFVEGATITEKIFSHDESDYPSVITIDNLYVSTHEVTRAEYKEIMGKEIVLSFEWVYDIFSTDGNADNNPAILSWYDAIVYCNRRSLSENLAPCYRINGSTNPDDWGEVPTEDNEVWNAVECDFTAGGYRLPTVPEWEYAAFGGNGVTGTRYKYAGSDDINEVAWYNGNSRNISREIKTKKANGLGLYDMSGNAAEWCWDFQYSYGSYRRYLGGSFGEPDINCEIAARDTYTKYFLRNGEKPYFVQFIGLRVVRTAE